MPIPSSPKRQSEFIWFDGDFVPWDEARIHVLSHVLHYGSSVFEGIRCYDTPDGPSIFRLQDHIDRLFFSARVMRMEMRFTPEQMFEASQEIVRRNKFEACYLRPLVFRGAGSMGVHPGENPIHCVIATWDWGAYLGKEGIEHGIDVTVSSWRKVPPGTIPPLAKIGGAYVLSTLAKLEAVRLGYSEAILLTMDGHVAEGTGENLFAVFDGRLVTPPMADSILGGITRKSVLQLAADLGIHAEEQSMPRGALYMAQEIFLSGTAAEVTPVRSVDGIPVGKGTPGPVTRRVQAEFFRIVLGETADRHGWLTPVAGRTASASATRAPS